MRYYAIRLSNAPAAFTPTPGAFIPDAQFCSVIYGINDPSALRVSIQVEIGPMEHLANGFIRIFGIDKDMMDQAADLTGGQIEVYGGFWPGLELATWESKFQGLLFQGFINSAFGNWKGSDMTLDILINPAQSLDKPSSESGGGGDSSGGGTEAASFPSRLVSRQRGIGRRRSRTTPPPQAAQFDGEGGIGGMGDIGSLFGGLDGFGGGGPDSPLKMIHDMKPGETLDSAMQKAMAAAFPNSKLVNLMKDGMKLDYHDAGFYQTIGQHLGYIKSLSKDLAKTVKYPGVSAYAVKNSILLADDTKAFGRVELEFIDLIGQPTWGGKDDDGKMLVNFMTPMRSDIYPSIDVIMPNDTLQFVTPTAGMYSRTTSGGLSGPFPRHVTGDRERITFNGPIRIKRVMIVGDSRNPQGEAWALSCTGIPNPWGAAPQEGSPNYQAPEPVAPEPAMARLQARGEGIGR